MTLRCEADAVADLECPIVGVLVLAPDEVEVAELVVYGAEQSRRDPLSCVPY
jgi:hypothetical protein